MDKTVVRFSKFLSLVLRHDPGQIGLTLDSGGWVDVTTLLAAANQAGFKITPAQLAEVVAQNDKQRFRFSEDGTRIRANQGHSVTVELGLTPQAPPTVLYHGTATRFLAAIQQEGLKPGSRQQVHLSADEATASKVGARHGKPVVLIVNSAQMAADGYAFYRADNGVWLTDKVPPVYLHVQEKT